MAIPDKELVVLNPDLLSERTVFTVGRGPVWSVVQSGCALEKFNSLVSHAVCS